jgi:glutamate dehydrogenase (NAD(P)+)
MCVRDIENEVDTVNPKSIYSFSDNNNLLGYLIVDSDINGVFGGGVRIVPDISKFELSHLAKNMTLKYAFLNIPFGGAKAAIITHQEDIAEEHKKDLIVRFAKNLTPFKRSYQPGKDVGISDQDHQLMLEAAGFKYNPATDSGFYTALSVFISSEESARQLNINLNNAAIAIEGFGKVGSHTAKLFFEAKAKVIAVSTSKGAIYNPEGLDIDHLLKLREIHHSDCVNKYGNAKEIKIEDLLVLPVDLLVPCALSWSINCNNAHRIRAKIVVCGANIPVTDKAKKILLDKNICYFPDFVSNSGGVFGAMMETLYGNKKIATKSLKQKITPKVKHLFALSKTNKGTLEQIAIDMADANRKKMTQKEQTTRRKLFSFALAVFKTGYMPKTLIRLLGPVYFKWTTKDLSL